MPADDHDTWLLAAWPGMGNVAVAAAAHLIQELGGELIEELPNERWFPVRTIDVKQGLTRSTHRSRNLLFRCRAVGGREILVFIGEEQPEREGYELCRAVVARALELGATRCASCAAMAGAIEPGQAPRVHVAATAESIRDLAREHGGQDLRDGQISGLNGVILAAAQERDLPAVSLLGDIPFFATGLPNPQASLACLRVFTGLADLAVDFGLLEEQAEQVEQTMHQLVAQLSDRAARAEAGATAPESGAESASEPEEVPPQVRERIEALFDAAAKDRDKAFELKRVLDQHGLFAEYEDRFLDLFKRAE